VTDREEIIKHLADLIEEISGPPLDDTFSEDRRIGADLDVDSLAAVELVVACEERFGIKIPDAEFSKATDMTVGEFADYITTAVKA
jgi:acyl carrier protein